VTPERRIALTLGITQTYGYATTYYLPAIILGVAAEELAVSRAALLGGFSLAMLASGLCAPRVGVMIDRDGGRGLMAASSLIIAVGLAMLSAAHGLVLWYAAWIVTGLGMSMGLYEAAFASIGRLYGQASRPIITHVTLIAGFASTIAWPVGTALLGPIGWRWLTLLYAGLHLALNLPLVLAFIPRPTTDPLPATAKGYDPAALAFARKAFILLAVFFTTRAAIASVLSVHIITVLEHVGLGTAAAVAMASLIGPGQVAGRVVEMAIGKRVDPLWSSHLGAVLLPLGVVALMLAGPPAAVVFTLAYGMSNGIITISKGTLPMALFGPNGYATLLGRLSMPSLIASALAPTLAAPLIDAWSGMSVLTLAGVLGAGAALCLIPLRLPSR
jgi:MFS family permease